MFDLQLLENNPNTPPFYLTLITVLSAFFLSSLIAITYEFTTKSLYKKGPFPAIAGHDLYCSRDGHAGHR